MVRRDFVGRAKMHFRHLPQGISAASVGNFLCHLFDVRRNATCQTETKLLPFPIKPIDKCLARQDGRRRDRDVRFRLWTLLNLDLAPMF